MDVAATLQWGLPVLLLPIVMALPKSLLERGECDVYLII